MPQEEVKFFRDFFEYRKKYYAIEGDFQIWWDKCVDDGIKIAEKYENTPFYEFVKHLIVVHQKDVSWRHING